MVTKRKQQRFQYLMTWAVIFLLLLAGSQTLQIQGLQQKIDGGELQLYPPSQQQGSVSQQRSAPTMVGGC